MAAAGHPPSLSQGAGMLANEQAQQTVGATVANAPETSDTYDVPAGLHTSDSVAGSGRSNVTTPGNELPGAFPRSPSTSGASPSTTTTLVESAQNTPATAQHAAPQHAAPVVHDATQPAAGVPTSPVDAAQPSRPLVVVGTLEGSGGSTNTNTKRYILPSQETSFTPSAGGVGSLPGTASEADVAKLPEERALERQMGGPVGREGALGPRMSQSGGAQAAVDAPAGPAPSGADTRGLASQVPDPQGVTSSHAGTTTSLDSDAQAAEAIVGRPSSTGNGRDKPLPTPGGHTSASRDGGLNPGGSSRRDIGNEQRDVDDPEGDGIRETESGGAQAKPGLDTKPTLKQKIKGEVKVLAGKIAKDPKKVEEGRAMKEGHTV